MRFDHILHWAPDRDQLVAAYRQAGFHVAIGGEHPHWGTHNALCHFGLPYIELLAARDAERVRSAPEFMVRGRERLLARGGGALTFVLAVPDLSRAVQELRARGLAVTDPVPGRRIRPDGSEVTWQTAVLTEGPAWRPFIIQWGQTDAERLPDLQARGIAAAHPNGAAAMQAITIATADPADDAAWWERLTGRPPDRTAAGWTAALPGCDLFLTPAPAAAAPAIARVRLTGGQPRTVTISGLELELLG